MLYICHPSGILDPSSTEALNTSKMQNGRGKVIMFNVSLSNIYHRFQTCTDLWSLALCRLPFHHINLSFYPIICTLICFNSTNVLHVLIDKVSLFSKYTNFSKKLFLNKVNLHNDGKILRRPTVLSRGWYDYQQVRQLFVSRA